MGYTRLQIALHWLIAGLILVQWFTADAMEDAFEPVDHGLSDAIAFGAGSMAHLVGGVGVLALLAVRLGVRLLQGVPPAPADLHPLLARVAGAAHWGFYLLLLLLPVSGLVAAFVQPDAGDPHGLLFNLLLALLVLHVAAVGFHSLVLRDGLLKRMLVSR